METINKTKSKTNSKSKPKAVCCHCKDIEKKAKHRLKINILLCDDCKKLDKYNLLTKTYAKTTYFLEDEDIQNLNFIKAKSTYGMSTYFTLEDIKNIFCNKYAIDNNNEIENKIKELNDIKEKIQEEKKSKRMSKNDKNIMRREKLFNALHKVGLVLRDDSKLCENYINGETKKIKIKDIVKRMCQMKYLFEYCHMDECKQKALEEQRETLEAWYFPDCYVFDEAERMALNEYSYGEYPEIYPWIIQEQTHDKPNKPVKKSKNKNKI